MQNDSIKGQNNWSHEVQDLPILKPSFSSSIAATLRATLSRWPRSYKENNVQGINDSVEDFRNQSIHCWSQVLHNKSQTFYLSKQRSINICAQNTYQSISWGHWFFFEVELYWYQTVWFWCFSSIVLKRFCPF